MITHQLEFALPDDFYSVCWQRKPIVIRAAIANFVSPLSPDDLAGLACMDGVESRIVVEKGGAIPWEVRHGPFEEKIFATLPESHWSLLVQAVDHWDDDVAALRRLFPTIPNWRIDDVMVSYAADGGSVGPHYDHYDVFLLQGQGQRRWLLGGPVRPDPKLEGNTELRLLRDFEIEEEFVTSYTNRVSGSEESRQATIWLQDQITAAGWTCEVDQWEAVLYSEPVVLRNVVCRLPGASDQEILVLAHHDIAPTTVQGADNDGSGVAILLHLAEIFASEGPQQYTLVFVSDDAEEFGMIGSRRYVETHPNPEKIIAGISLDNLGRSYYKDMDTELVGQYEGYAPIWIGLAAREAAQASGTDWEVILKGPIDQVLNQAITISFTDQGPINAAGVPAIGFGARVPAEFSANESRWVK